MQVRRWSLGLILSVGLLASSGTDASPVHGRMDALAVAIAAKNPLSSVEPPLADERGWRGRVEEVLSAGGYRYLRVRSEDDVDWWVVTLASRYREGELVDVKNMGTRSNFRSKRLGRTFDRLVFGIVRKARG